MSKITKRDTRVVPLLPAETLYRLIRYRGLDACGELVTSATPAQLTSLLDLDLWRPARPGRDEQFDVERFAEWLEVLVDTGESVAARTVAALDKNLVAAGLSRFVRVFDPGIFEPTAQSDDEPIARHEAMREGGGGDGLECEVGGYLVRARRADTWDAIVALLSALDADHSADFHAIMQGCRRLANSRPEIDGLDALLQAPEQHLHEVTIEREHRRSQQGYATPGDARAFLEMARQPKHIRSGASPSTTTVNPIVTAYFRAVDEGTASSHAAVRSPNRASISSGSTASQSELDAVIERLTEAGVMPQRPRALPNAGQADSQPDRLTDLRRLMASVRDTDESAYLTRSRELAFLANALLAGCSVQSRSFTPEEASHAAAGICNLGLECWPAQRRRAGTFPPDSLPIDGDLVIAFEVGWSVLHRDVCMFAAEQLISTLTDVDGIDHDMRRGLDALRRALVKHHHSGTPWRARDAAEILAALDITAWISVRGLLDECPIIPAALTAVLEGRTTPVSPTAFEFISTTDQIGDVRRFMRKLPDVLTQ